MKKNVIFWIGVKNKDHNDKYGNFEYFEYSKNTWKHFCKRFNCEFVEFNEPIQKDLFEYRVNWQKAIYVFEHLDKLGIEYDQIALVDSTCMYKWDAPNFFELTENKFTAWRDNDNLNWIYQSVQGYKEFFKDYELNISKYINSGFIIFNESHKSFFNSFKELYESNKSFFINAQDKTVRKGTEQTPLNYWLQINNIEVKIDLPLPFKLTHLNRKELFNYNWQLNKDQTPFFIKYGYNWIFNGIPKDQRSSLMGQLWSKIKHLYTDESYTQQLIESTAHKDTAKYTTSKKFKQDVVSYFKNFKDKTYLELGSCQGNSILIYSTLFKSAIGLEFDDQNIQTSEHTCRNHTNIDIYKFNVLDDWNSIPTADVINLDALHNEQGIRYMLTNAKKFFPNSIFIMDDYGHIGGTIKVVIDELINLDKIEILNWIGEDKGYTAANKKVFVDKEGLIFKFK